jgi:hypothetical protein
LVAEFNGHVEIDVGLVNRVAAPVKRSYLRYLRGSGRPRQ